jgi:hypothetical protein
MHDSQIEERLRSVLRAEGDRLPLTIATVDLERRLILRRRAAAGRRFSLVAAVIGAIAIGSVVAAGNGWLRLPAIGVAVSPSTSPRLSPSTPLASPTPTVLPSAPPGASPRSDRSPLGQPYEAVLVHPVGDPVKPDALEVTLFDPTTVTSRLFATIPGTAFPADAGFEGVAPPSVSPTGWLAIPITHPTAPDGTSPEIVIVDLVHPSAPSWLIDGYGSGVWNGSDQFALEGPAGVTVADPALRQLHPVSIADPAVSIGVTPHSLDPVWATAPGSRFLALRSATPANEWGAIDANGDYTPMTDLPAAYQRTGLERVVGVAAHTIAMGCDTGGATPSAGGCVLVETDADGTVVSSRVNSADVGALYDFAWAANGRDVWLLFDGGTDASGHSVSLSVSTPNGSRTEQSAAKIYVPVVSQPRILGIGPATSADTGYVAIGDDSWYVRSFVAIVGGTVTMGDVPESWFAGWAGEQPDYDPD